MIHRTPHTDPRLRRKLAHLDELRSALAHEVGVAARWDGLMRREALIDAVTGSTSIEGYSVEAGAARLLMERAAPPADEESMWAVACYARAMEHIAVFSDDPAFEWSERVVLDLHFDACVFQRDRSPGRWRTGPVFVRRGDGTIEYEAPMAEQVPPLMRQVAQWLRSEEPDLHVVVRAAMAHLHVVSIHPFRDGNGRISRLVQSLVLARDGVLSASLGSIESYLARNTALYYEHLQRAHGATYDPSIDVYEWVDFCVDAHIEQATDRLKLLAGAARRWNALEALVEGRSWPDRLVIALEYALAGHLDRRAYLEQADVSVPTASNDFRRLVDAGLIEPIGRGRSTSYVATASLRSVLQ